MANEARGQSRYGRSGDEPRGQAHHRLLALDDDEAVVAPVRRVERADAHELVAFSRPPSCQRGGERVR